jgi:hypothetical protein
VRLGVKLKTIIPQGIRKYFEGVSEPGKQTMRDCSDFTSGRKPSPGVSKAFGE